MKKENLVAMILGIIGGIPFALGMVMALMSEWGLLVPGIITGAIGLVVLLSIIPVYRKMTGRTSLKLDSRTLITMLIGLVGAGGLGAGLGMILHTNDIPGNPGRSILAIAIGLVGIVLCIVNYPIYKTLAGKKESK